MRKTKIRRYYHDVNYYRQSSVKRVVRWVILILVLLLIAAGVALGIDAWRQEQRTHEASRPSTPKTSAYNVPSKTFTTKYFELETRPSWEFIKKDSGRDHFVYHDVRHKLVQGVFTIYVNGKPPPEHLRATRLLPVKLGSDGFLKPDPFVTAHCNKTASNKDRVGEQMVKLKKVTFMCDNDATWYSVLVGLEGGTAEMKLKRPDGTTATYVIFYQDSTASPTSTKVVEVIRKFKVR